jgi:hypothetical protein
MSLGFEAVRSGALGYSSGKEPYSQKSSSRFYEELKAQQSQLSRSAEAGFSGPSLNQLLSSGSFGLKNQTSSLGRASSSQPASQEPIDPPVHNSLDYTETISAKPGIKSVALSFNDYASLGASGSGELGIFLSNGKNQLFTGHNLFYHRSAIGLRGELQENRANYELKAYHDHDQSESGVIAKISFSF